MRLNPSGTAINSTVQQVAGAIGTAVFVTVRTTYEKTRITELKGTMNQTLLQKQALLDAIKRTSFVTIGLVVVATLLSVMIRKRICEE
ncbi:hypothetical protein ACIQ57_05470 [Lysinibacillus xylanilyticus]|uniref:hypothetical protein n=1 Tax=Lysinibacillus xylanilyticus TaxID=582475 RepID=UPI0037F15C34